MRTRVTPHQLISRPFLLFLCWILLPSFSLRAQEISPSSWKYGVFFTPAMVVNHATSGEIAFAHLQGIRAERSFSNRFSIGSGLSAYRIKIFNGSWYGASCGSPNSICHWYSDRTYLEIPMHFTFFYGSRTSNIDNYVTLGLLTSLSVSTNDKRLDEFDDRIATEHFKTNGIQYQSNYLSLAFGSRAQLNSKLQLMLEPTFRYSLHSMIGWIDDNYTMMAGLNIGLVWTP